MPTMDKDILKNKKFAFGGYRFSSAANSFNVNPEAPAVDVSAFEDPANRYRKGPLDSRITMSGGVTSAAEVRVVTSLADADDICEPFTLCAEDGSLDSVALLLEAEAFNWQRQGQRGSLMEFSADIMGQGDIYPGKVLYNNVGGTVISATGVGTGINLGGTLGAGQVLVASLHVLTPPGIGGTTPTLDVVVESDADAGFAAPVTRLTFAQVTTTPGGQLLLRDGDTDPVTPHTWYRPNFTVSGTSVEYTVIMAIAIATKL